MYIQCKLKSDMAELKTYFSGSYGGGDLILISGVGFESALVITLCDNVCHISGTISYTQVMCVTPPHTGKSVATL